MDESATQEREQALQRARQFSEETGLNKVVPSPVHEVVLKGMAAMYLMGVNAGALRAIGTIRNEFDEALAEVKKHA